MAQRSEKLRDLPLEDVKAHPEIITDLLSGDEDVSVVLEKHGDTVRFAAMRTYDRDSVRILEEARADHRRRKARGYSREEAFADLEAVLDEVDRHS